MGLASVDQRTREGESMNRRCRLCSRRTSVGERGYMTKHCSIHLAWWRGYYAGKRRGARRG